MKRLLKCFGYGLLPATQGQQLIPADGFGEMITPAAAYRNYGVQLWLGNDHEWDDALLPNLLTTALDNRGGTT